MRILLVEDDTLLGNGIEAGLKHSGFTIDWAKDGHEAQLALETGSYELLVLDIGLPVINGMDLLKRLRREGNHTPVLMLTARDSIADRVKGLDAGADDYLLKPFDLSELVARIHALTRRAHGRSSTPIHYTDLIFEPKQYWVRKGSETIQLSPKESAILGALLNHCGTALSRSQLENSLYGWNEEIESNAVEVHVYHLRQKLGANLIKTIRGVGYLIRKESS
ncbi:MAG TPA: response regulator [Burkholderiales bacterium]|nr:response regulator [Burkholderiales bacterium]